MSHLFILDENKNVIPVDDVLKWGEWMQNGDRRVAREDVGETLVSTVFLGTGHGWIGDWDADPFLFETMTFPGGDIKNRYRTYVEALEGHKQIVKSLQAEF